MTTAATDAACPVCGSGVLRSGLECRGVPAHSVMLHYSRESALATPCGDIALAGCAACGFVFNAAYDPNLHHYRDRYESTQAFSETFKAFHEMLAAEIADAVGQDEAPVVEIGCGQGEFLSLLKKRGCGRLVGFDPAYDAKRSTVTGGAGIEIFARPFDVRSVTGMPRAIVCKMTVEHIAQPVAMLRQMAELANRSSRCEIFVQVPNANTIFSLGAFWDVYYEHCNYFTARTLDHSLQCAGLNSVTIMMAFAEQYILARARRTLGGANVDPAPSAEIEMARFEQFCRDAANKAKEWRDRIGGWIAADERIMLWGGGSKAVAFVSFTETEEHLLGAIDINPRKSNTFLPGSGLRVVSPTQAKAREPTVIILLNPVYRGEVERECSRLGLEASLVALGA